MTERSKSGGRGDQSLPSGTEKSKSGSQEDHSRVREISIWDSGTGRSKSGTLSYPSLGWADSNLYLCEIILRYRAI